jgi:hypothetical protein
MYAALQLNESFREPKLEVLDVALSRHFPSQSPHVASRCRCAYAQIDMDRQDAKIGSPFQESLPQENHGILAVPHHTLPWQPSKSVRLFRRRLWLHDLQLLRLALSLYHSASLLLPGTRSCPAQSSTFPPCHVLTIERPALPHYVQRLNTEERNSLLLSSGGLICDSGRRT